MIHINEITEYSNAQIPDTLEDLTQFVLVGKAKLQAYMLKLQTVNKLSVAQEIRDQTLKETQEVSNALIAAEQRIGELLLEIPKAQGFASTIHHNDVENVKTKTETIKEMGYGRREAEDYQQMAKNPEIVQKVIEDALANGTIVTKSQVLKEIKAAKEEQSERIRDLREERDYLQSRVEELQNAEPQVIERTIEVVPDDYETAKIQARSAEKARKEVLEKLRAAEIRIKDLEERKDISEIQKKLEEEAGYFTIRTYDYIQKNGGFVWITERLEQLPESQRKEFVNTVYAIDAFAKQMVQNIGGYGIE